MTDTTLPKAMGMPYTQFLTALHEKFLFDWYLEIGSRKGDSFALSAARPLPSIPSSGCAAMS